MNDSGILGKIVEEKRKSLRKARKKISLETMKKKLGSAPKTLDFFKAVSKKPFSLIAEVKKSSPSEGIIIKRFSPETLARTYADAGVSAISVLTEEKFFSGKTENIMRVKKASGLPVLRKDFILDEWQVYESRLAGADAVLLIASILSGKVLKELFTVAGKLGMTPLVEVYGAGDFAKIEGLPLRLAGINSRDLRTGKINLDRAARYAKKVKAKVLVCESGIERGSDIDRMRKAGFGSFLIGTSILKSRNRKKFIEELLGGSKI